MLNFKRISLEDKETFSEYSSLARTLACTRSFSYVYTWASVMKTEVAFGDEAVFLRFPNKDCYMYVSPLVAGDASKAIETLLCEDRGCDCPFKLISADDEVAGAAREMGFKVVETPNSSEYLYSAGDLIELKGKKLHAKRNFFNRFIRENEFTYERLTTADADECLQLTKVWSDGREDFWIQTEYKALERAFSDWNCLDFLGAVIRINGKIVSFTIGEVTPQMGIVHFEKADASIIGLYAAINKLFAEDAFSSVLFINRQEDLGLEGLRKAKQSYHPVSMVTKYEIMCK